MGIYSRLVPEPCLRQLKCPVTSFSVQGNEQTLLWSRCGPERRDPHWYCLRSCTAGLPGRERNSSSMKWVPESPEFLRNCCKNELQGTTQSRHICWGQEPYRRGALSAGAHPRPLSTPTEHRASNACQSQGAWRQLMRVSVQIRPLSFNASFFPHFTQKCSKKISKPGKVEIEYREVERKPSISSHFYCRFPTWSILETPD